MVIHYKLFLIDYLEGFVGIQNVVVVGLGRVGADFLGQLLRRKDLGINIVCASELGDTVGKTKAIAAGVAMKRLDEIISMGDAVDIIFDLTGSATVRRRMRDGLAESDNKHTVIVSENVAHIIWSLLTNKLLPEIHTSTAY